MKLQALLLTSLLALGSIPAQAHHQHTERHHAQYNDNLIIPSLILGGALVGGALILDNNHSTHYYHRRNRKPVRVVDSYRSGGRHYRICRQGRRAFYC